MVGNKAQKAVAAALTGIMALGSAAPALADTQINSKWTRLDGAYTNEITTIVQKDGVEVSKETKTVTTGGENRYDTMFDLVMRGFEDDKWDGNNIVLVAGTSYADALSASGLAGALDAPIVSTPGDKLGEQAKNIIADCIAAKDEESNEKAADEANAEKPAAEKGITVHIVGGTAAVAAEVEDQIRALSIASHVATKENSEGKAEKVTTTNDKGETVDVYAPAQPVHVLRVAGSDRTETSLKVMDEINKYVKNNNQIGGFEGNGVTIYAANGWAPYDALSVSSFAYRNDSAILLTGADGHLTDAQIDYLKNDYNDYQKLRVTDFRVIGGPASAAFQDANDANIPFASESLTSGEDRYETSKLVIQRFGRRHTKVVVATGQNWADALVGAPFAAEYDADIALVGDAEKDANWDAAIKAAKETGKATEGYILGGTSAVNKSTEDRLVTYL